MQPWVLRLLKYGVDLTRRVKPNQARLLRHQLSRAEDAIQGEMIWQAGMVTVYWAMAEGALDSIVGMLHVSGGAKHIQRELPRSLKVKLEYIKRSKRFGLIGEGFTEDLENIRARMQAMSSFRHDFTHGLGALTPDMQDWTIRRGVVLHNCRIDQATTYSHAEISAKVGELIQLSKDIREISGRMSSFILAKHGKNNGR